MSRMINSSTCRRVSLDNPPVPADVLRDLANYAGDVPADKYMTGELFDRLESQVKELLGKESAIYLPSGKLAQLAALKALTSRSGISRLALHPRSHIEEYEARSYQELWGMTSVHFGEYDRLPTAFDIHNFHEPIGAVVLELPMRRLGCLLPSWEQLVAITNAAHEKQIPIHMDGARLWESQPFYGKPLHEISNLFDTLYVSFDKGLGGLAGGALAGPKSVIDEVKIWQRRAGGRVLRSFPNLLSSLKGLEERLPQMAAFHEKAKSFAKSLVKIPGVRVSPEIPHANAFLVTLQGDTRKAVQARDRLAEEQSIWLFDNVVDCIEQNTIRFEVTIRSAAFDIESSEIKQAVIRFSELVQRQ